MPQYLKSEIYASQTIQAFACGFTRVAQPCAGKLSFTVSDETPTNRKTDRKILSDGIAPLYL
ncbi:TPA: hypothetical protein ACFB5N_001734 [Neisseria gonorrhoeae]